MKTVSCSQQIRSSLGGSKADGHMNRSSHVYLTATGERFHHNMLPTVVHQAKSVTKAY